MLPVQSTWGSAIAENIARAQATLGRDMPASAATFDDAVQLAADGAAWTSFCRGSRRCDVEAHRPVQTSGLAEDFTAAPRTGPP